MLGATMELLNNEVVNKINYNKYFRSAAESLACPKLHTL